MSRILVSLASSITLAIVIARVAPDLLYKNTSWSALLVWTVHMLALMLYRVILYPYYFSPLLSIPHAPVSLRLPDDAHKLTIKGGSLFMGHFFQIVRQPTGEPMKPWLNDVPNDGLIEYKSAFNQERVLVTTPKALAEVLTTKAYDFVKPPQLRGGLARILGVGILLAEGDEHKRQRKSLGPAFAFRHIKDLYPVFWAKGVEMVKALAKDGSDICDVGPWVNRATLDIIGIAGMGRDFNALADPTNELYQTYQRIFKPSRVARIFGFLSIIFPAWLINAIPIKRNDDIREASGTVRRVAFDLIQQKKKDLADGVSGIDILSVALESGGFSDESLVDQAMTGATSMQWAILELGRHPKIQEKLRQELLEAGFVSPLKAESDPSTIEKVPYLAAVCNEVLRFHPPVPMTLRVADCDTSIAGHFIPKGTSVMLFPEVINKSQELWGPDAEKFNPDRWIKAGEMNRGGSTSNYAFLTFLHGPRSCIGAGFARAEFQTLLATWVLAFATQLEDPSKEFVAAGGITANPKGGLQVKLSLV